MPQGNTKTHTYTHANITTLRRSQHGVKKRGGVEEEEKEEGAQQEKGVFYSRIVSEMHLSSSRLKGLTAQSAMLRYAVVG